MDFWAEVKEQKEIMSTSEKKKKRGNKKKKKILGEKEKEVAQTDSTRKRIYAPAPEKKAKNIGKVRRMNVNPEDEKDEEEKEKDIDKKENEPREVSHNSETSDDMKPATVATARESSRDHHDMVNAQPDKEDIDIEGDYEVIGENEDDILATPPSPPLPVNQG